MLFLADESCDASVSRALRAAGHDVKAIAETAPGTVDRFVLDTALSEQRVLLTEDKDFGRLVFESGAPTTGVILIRFPATARLALPQAVIDLVRARQAEIAGHFVVIGPSRVRVSSLPSE